MPRSEDHFVPDPRVEATLAVIDATLAGEAVQPEQAEMAELSLILAEQRPAPRPQFTAGLDARVQRRFAVTAPEPGSRRRHRRRWLYAPGAVVGAAAATAVVIALAGGGLGAGSRPPLPERTAVPSTAAGKSAPAATGPRSGFAAAPSHESLQGHSAGSTPASASPASASSGSASSGVSSPAPAPHTGGRQVVQSAQLGLSAAPSRVDDVAQQVFDVVSAQNGFVQSSNVTAANNSSGYAEFQLTVPSGNLQATLSALSRLHGASVVSRTDGTQDITGEVGGAGRRLAEARALRSSLLRQLAAATSQTQVASLKAQLRDADAAIARDAAKLNALHRQVDNSQISVTINPTTVPGSPSSGGGGGFTLGTAVHDAARVLVVAAGVALIALAVLVPLSLLGAVGLWAGLTVRRRRREQALDLV